MESHTFITVRTEGGAEINLKRICQLIPAGGSGPPPRPIRYELLTGEAVEETGFNEWQHPLNDEKLLFVRCGWRRGR